MRIALLSHRGANIGHDFMAIGMEEILRATFSNVQITQMEQHRPFDIYPERSPLRRLNRIKNPAIQRWLSTPTACRLLWPWTLPLPFDLAIGCGGPNIPQWRYIGPQMRLMFHHLPGAFHYHGVPVIDAAVGSAFPLTMIPERIEERGYRAYCKRLFSFCSGITVRDRLAQKLWTELGAAPILLPCAAFCSGSFFERECNDVQEGGYLLVNYQRRGANDDWGQQVDASSWRATVAAVIAHFQAKGLPVHILSHSAKEHEDALTFGVPAHYPRTYQDYGNVIRSAHAGLVSRLHAGIPLAGVGVPALVAGTDTRLYSIDELGLPTIFAKDATSASIITTLENLLAHREEHRQRLLALRTKTVKAYGEIFRSVARH